MSKNIVKFRKTRDEYGWMSNFAKYPVQVDGVFYPTTEHYYQCQKTDNPDDMAAILKEPSPKGAAIKGRSIQVRPNWNSIKLDAMRNTLLIKIDQHPELKEKLLATGDSLIQEDAPWDSFWGTGKDGNGDNWMGRLWMEIREVLRKTQNGI